MTKLTADLVRSLVEYDPETGRFTWKERGVECFSDGYRTAEGNCANWNKIYAGKPAFTSDSGHGYRVGSLLGKKVYAHRIAWMICFGSEPKVIDHINGNRSDNRIVNLRSVSFVENARNACIGKNNKSGHVGVSWCNATSNWQATIWLDGEQKRLGTFDRLEDAILARANAALGEYHENHGRAK